MRSVRIEKYYKLEKAGNNGNNGNKSLEFDHHSIHRHCKCFHLFPLVSNLVGKGSKR